MAEKSANILVLGKTSKLARCLDFFYGNTCTFITHDQCDITDYEQLESLLRESLHEYVINCIAITDMRYCEKNPIKCFNVNVTGTFMLNRLCKKYNKKLIHISSNYAINPPNIYGWSKKLSEAVIDPNFLIIRGNFYSSEQYIINKLLKRQNIQAYNNVFFAPVSINRFVHEIYINRTKTGIINFFTDTPVSYYEFSLKIANQFSIDKKLIEETKYVPSLLDIPLGLNSICTSDIPISLDQDLEMFKIFLEKVTTNIV